MAKKLEQECYNNFIKRFEDEIIKHPKMFWSFVKSNKKGSNSLPFTLYYERQSADTGEEVCNLFDSYFQSTFLLSSAHRADSSHSPLNSAAYNVSASISNVEIKSI